MDEIALDTRCQTCFDPRGAHYVTYDGTPGCHATKARGKHRCHCQGFMLTESETLRNEYLAQAGMAVFRDVVSRLDQRDAQRYRATRDDAAPTTGEG